MTHAERGGEVDFALIGHQENWDQIADIVRGLRRPGDGDVPIDDIRSIVPWIPPRTVSRVRVGSWPSGTEARGVYIDTFITPDELAAGSLRSLLTKVRDAAKVAEREGARVAALGGFTSIVLEGRLESLGSKLAFTTGNTTTAALIVNGITDAAERVGIALPDATVLIVGGTGDVGSGCARWLAPRVGKLLLAARNRARLADEVGRLRAAGHDVAAVTDLDAALASSEVILSAASMAAPTLDVAATQPGALICDAGYPKNLVAGSSDSCHIFWGGMGVARGGIRSDDGMLERFYRFPVGDVGHGCMLEGLLLGLAGRFEPFSSGRGNITPDRIDEIWSLAGEHGFTVAPFFNAQGAWPAATASAVR